MGKIFFISLAAAGLFNSPAHAQTCTQINKGIASISEEIKTMQTEGISDNSAPRATMRASRMTFGAQAQANLMEYGKTLGCKFSGLKLPTSIGIWPNANWYEREAWDLFGVVFECFHQPYQV